MAKGVSGDERPQRQRLRLHKRSTAMTKSAGRSSQGRAQKRQHRALRHGRVNHVNVTWHRCLSQARIRGTAAQLNGLRSSCLRPRPAHSTYDADRIQSAVGGDCPPQLLGQTQQGGAGGRKKNLRADAGRGKRCAGRILHAALGAHGGADMPLPATTLHYPHACEHAPSRLRSASQGSIADRLSKAADGPGSTKWRWPSPPARRWIFAGLRRHWRDCSRAALPFRLRKLARRGMNDRLRRGGQFRPMGPFEVLTAQLGHRAVSEMPAGWRRGLVQPAERPLEAGCTNESIRRQ